MLRGTRMWGRAVLCTMAGLFLGGCTVLGPSSIQATRLDYNVAVQRTTDEQLLLNLVRLRYRDTPSFIEISSISSQLSIRSNASVSTTITSGSEDIGLSAGAQYFETPTISYAPLQGEDFVKRLLSPVTVDQIVLLARSGWSVARILRIGAQRLNDLRNAPRASGPTPTTEPVFREFVRVTELLRELQLQDGLELTYEVRDGQSLPVLRFSEEVAGGAQLAEIRSLLGLATDRLSYVLSSGIAVADPGTVRVNARSLLGMMFFLSQAVAVPGADAEAGRVTVTRSRAGGVFDWQQVAQGLFSVRQSSARPQNTAVAVPYRGHWFYVDDSDLSSKSTFSFLAQMFALQAGSTESIKPVLTLPIGG